MMLVASTQGGLRDRVCRIFPGDLKHKTWEEGKAPSQVDYDQNTPTNYFAQLKLKLFDKYHLFVFETFNTTNSLLKHLAAFHQQLI